LKCRLENGLQNFRGGERFNRMGLCGFRYLACIMQRSDRHGAQNVAA
jgi:hypothetical protein